LPPSTTVYVYAYGLTDLAGNTSSSTHTFTTGSGEDKTAPQIESISPANGAMNIGPSNPIVLTFSESMRNNTLNYRNIMLFIDGAIVNPSIYTSPDNRIISITTQLPSAKSITVVVTSDVQDLAGNALADYASTFSTAVVNTTTNPEIRQQTPVSGASKVRDINSITLYASKQLDVATLSQGVYVTADGVLVPGNTSLDSTQQVINFVATSPLPENALIEVYATDIIRDIATNPLHNYHASFRTGSNSGATPGVKPTVEAIYPNNREAKSLNPIIELAFTETLNPESITTDRVQIRKNRTNGEIQNTILTLSDDGRRVRLKPSNLLEANTRYWINLLPDISDIDGDKTINTDSYEFTTSATAVADTQSPLVIMTSPIDGSQNAPINPTFHIRFDEEIHPFVNTQGNDQVSFLAGNKEIRYVKDHALKADSENTETFSGILDRSGNAIINASIRFKTSKQVDSTAPEIVNTTPKDTAVNVPVNTLIRIVHNEPLNPVSLDSVFLYDVTRESTVAATISLSVDGRELSVTPAVPLRINHIYRVSSKVQDFAENAIIPGYNRFSFSFATGLEADAQAPVIQSATINEGQTALPLNTRLRVRFNEPVNIQKLAGTVLTLSGALVPATINLSDDRLLLTLTPKQLLASNAAYVFSVSGIEDLSGNRLAEALVRQFTTAAKVDSYPGFITGMVPISNATNVPLNTRIEITLSESLDPTTLTSRAFSLYDIVEDRSVEGRVEISTNKQNLVFIPNQPLKPSYRYEIRTNYYEYFYDMAGNQFPNWNKIFTTAANELESIK
jgi:hypothetical protein